MSNASRQGTTSKWFGASSASSASFPRPCFQGHQICDYRQEHTSYTHLFTDTHMKWRHGNHMEWRSSVAKLILGPSEAEREEEEEVLTGIENLTYRSLNVNRSPRLTFFISIAFVKWSNCVFYYCPLLCLIFHCGSLAVEFLFTPHRLLLGFPLMSLSSPETFSEN